MNSLLLVGTRTVVFALLAYSLAGFLLHKKRTAAGSVLAAQNAGILLDILATIFMIVGSTNSPFTVHGFLGYTALTGMLFETFLLWRFRFRKGKAAPITEGFFLYSRIAYAWWVIAFVVGALLVLLK